MTPNYIVDGFEVEAIVESLSDESLTASMIIAIIIGIAFLIVVITICLLAAWIIMKIVESTPDILVPGVGIVILIGLAIVLLLLFGVGFKGKGVKVGRGVT